MFLCDRKMLCRCVIHSRIFEARGSFEPPEITHKKNKATEQKTHVLRMQFAFTL